MESANPFIQEQWNEGLQRWPTSISQAVQRANLFRSLQQDSSKPPAFQELDVAVKQLEPLLRESTTTEKEGYGQVCFQGSPWSGLNSIPFALTFLSIYKSYIVPAFSLLVPVIACLFPYILLKAFYNIPIKFSEYTALLWRLWNGQGLPKNPRDLLTAVQQPAEQVDILTRLKQLGQNGWTLFTIGQTMWQPIQQARHFMRLDTECKGLGDAILKVRAFAADVSKRFAAYVPNWLSDWVDHCPTAGREAFAFVMDNPFWLPHTLRALGRFEVLHVLSKKKDVCAVKFVSSATPVLVLKGFGDPSIPFDKRVRSSLVLGQTAKHSILTGPNRGGKSSCMRGTLLNLKLAHAFGCCYADAATMSYFSWIADGLRLDDLPGKESMFEREVGFASGVLQKASSTDKFGFVIYDELFHSTNPPDAKRTSELFCSSLWKSNTCLSLVSTHIYSLASSAPESVKKLCLASWKLPNGKYKFSYKVQKGICEVSSVDLLLKQFHLIADDHQKQNSASDQK